MVELIPYKQHEEYRASMYPDQSPLEFVGMVCNNPVVLPQDGLSPTLHAPMIYWMREDGQLNMYYGQPQPGTLDYLVILPDIDESDVVVGGVTFRRNTPVNAFVLGELARAGIPLDRCGVTRAIRFVHPAKNRKPGSGHKRTCAVYAMADALATQPKVIIAMGAAAVKSLYGQNAKLTNMRGNVVYFGDSMVIPTESPKSFLGGYAGIGVFRSELKRARRVCEGTADLSLPPSDGHRVCRTREAVEQLISDLHTVGAKRLAIDCEWGNDVGRDEYSYTRSIQLCWAAGQAAFIVLRGEGGTQLHDEDDAAAIWQMVVDYVSQPDVVLIGHNLRVDVDRFHREGFDIDEKVATGFDTMLVHHLLYNDDMQGLDNLTRKYTPQFGAFWQRLEDWLDAHPDGRNKVLRFGYRDIPDEILEPYGLRDADITFRCAKILEGELEAEPRLKALYWNLSAPTSLQIMDMERQGLLIDVERRRNILHFYEPIRDYYAELVRKELNWPTMNPSSEKQVKTALFYGSGTVYSDMRTPPKGVKALGLRPLYTSGKYPKPWVEVEAAGAAKFTSPSTNNATLELLYINNPKHDVLLYLRHYSAVSKLITSYLADPVINEFGVPEDGSSLGQNIYDDGRARTHISQITSTGRYTSSRANLQTWPKKQEDALLAAAVFYKFGIGAKDYKAQVKAGAIPPDDVIDLQSVKSCVMAPPGHKLIEVDFKTAELYVWAFASGDPALIRVIQMGRNLHSENAARAFQLPELAELDHALALLEAGQPETYHKWADNIAHTYPGLRTAAKNIIFGVMYGRGAAALCREISKTGVEITVADCQRIIDTIATAYPVAWQMLETNARLAVEQEYVETEFARRRAFTGIQYGTRSDQAAAGRQAKNSPIQGLVADLLSQAGVLLYRMSKTETGRKLGFRVLLPIHDAYLLEVPEQHVESVKKLLHLCMSTLNKIPGTDYNLGIDIEVMDRWGEH